MTDASWKRKEPDSPCVQICVVHPVERMCTGCYRTIDEISQWSKLDPQDRAKIIADLPSRAPRLTKRRGGRTARLKL